MVWEQGRDPWSGEQGAEGMLQCMPIPIEWWIAMVPLVLTGVGVTGVSILLLQRRRRRHQIWRAFATERKGVFRRRWWSGPLVECNVGDARVVMDTHHSSAYETGGYNTRARAAFVFPPGPEFRVYREGTLARVAKTLGAQDVIIGLDRTFDDMFVVKCDNPDRMRLVWTDQAVRLMRTTLPDGFVRSDGTHVTVEMRGLIDKPAILHALVDLGGALARRLPDRRAGGLAR